MISKYLILADVHGSFDEVHTLLREVDFWKNPRQICSVGDLIDKYPGTDNYKKLLKLFHLLEGEGFFTMVKGNHEEKHLKFENRYLREQATGQKNQMGPAKHPEHHLDFWATRKQLLELREEGWDPYQWLEKFPFYKYIDDKLCVVHGGLEPNKRPEQMLDNVICRVRQIKSNGRMASLNEVTPEMEYWADIYDRQCEKDDTLPFIIYGHANFAEQRKTTKTWGIDTLINGKKLCAVLYPEMELVQVPLKEDYFKDTQEGD